MTGRCPTCNQPLPDTNAQRRDPPLPPPYPGFSNDAETEREHAELKSGRYGGYRCGP